MSVRKEKGKNLWVVVMCLLVFGFGCRVIESGEVGVRMVFGKVDNTELKPGIHFFVPAIISIVPMEVRVKKIDFTGDTISSLTKDGLMVYIEATILYRILEDSAAETYVRFGRNWDDKLITPLVRSVARDVANEFTASQIYQEREKFQKKLEDVLKSRLSKESIVLEQILIRNLELPKNVVQAIEQKIQSLQEAERMEYVVQKEKLEAERKRVEAEGIAKAQKIIAGSLNTPYLQWKYIDTLSNLVNSPNNTIVVLPFDTKLVPLLPLQPK